MEYRNLGSTGVKVSVVGIGCNNFGRRCDQGSTTSIVDKAIESGITLFDTADVYGPTGLSEEYLGKALRGRRHEIVLASKFGSPMGEGDLMRGASRRYLFNAVEASLKRLDTDYLDLYQLHFPDPSTPIEETLAALDDLIRQGKVRYIGNSNFNGWQIADADWIARRHNLSRFVTAQNLYSLLDRRIEREVVPACERFGLGILPYFPLASGMLTGKYTRGEAPPQGSRLEQWGGRAAAALSDQNFEIVENLTAFAEERDHSLLELAFSWMVSRPYICSVIAGATTPDQVVANAAAASWQMSAEEQQQVAQISKQ